MGSAYSLGQLSLWNKSIFPSYSIGDGYTPSDTTASGEKVHVGGIACPRDIDLDLTADFSFQSAFSVITVSGQSYPC